MSHPNAEKSKASPAATPNPPPYPAVQPYMAPELSAPPMASATPLLMPPQFQTCHAAPGEGCNQALVLQPTQTVIFSVAQPVHEPDYLAYSIFTLLCCCLPVGIAAVIYSVKTKNANHSGNSRAAQQYSSLARTLGHIALGVGIVGSVLCFIFTIVIFRYKNISIHHPSLRIIHKEHLP